jgi:hypothetical protein
MKHVVAATVMAALAAAPLMAREGGGNSISGSYVEARTAEVFTGGCIMNGEAATTGREALLVWKVDRGSFDGVALNGFEVVELSSSPIQFVDESDTIRVSAKSLRLTVSKELNHDPSCGARQWFHPLAEVSNSAMGTTAENSFEGAALGTKWSDPNKRSSFFGTFSY